MRRPEIVAGTIECLKQHGFVGTTLSRIADTCNMSRGHIRHYMGNRDAILLAAAQEFFEEDPEVPQPGLESLAEILDYYFGDSFTDSNDENAAVRAFLDASQEIPAIRDLARNFYLGQRDVIAQAIQAEHPDSNKTAVTESAHAVITLALGNAFLSDVGAEVAHGELPRRIVEQILSRIQ